MIKILLALFIAAAPAAAQGDSGPDRSRTYRLVYDPSGKGGMEAGVTLAGDLSALLYRGFTEGAEAAGIHKRWYLRPAALAFAVNGLPSPGNFIHEYYGHGSALRESGFDRDIDYSWGWFLGAEGNAVSMEIQTAGTYEEKQLWVMGGLASSQLYLLQTEKEIYRKGRMDLSAAKALFAAHNDLGYVWDGLDVNKDPNTAANDGTSWLKYLKQHNGNSQSVAAEYADKGRQAIDRAALYDPAVYWGVVTALHYLWTGDDGFYAPAVPVAGFRLGFSPKVNFTPVGPENYYYFFVARGDRLASLYVRDGLAPQGSITGFGAEFGPLRLFGLELTPGYDSWQLPETGLAELPSCASGWAARLRADVKVHKALGVTATGACKTEGYLLGQPPGKGCYGYAGLSLSF